MARERTNSDEEFLDMADCCPVCEGYDCGDDCKNLASMIVNNATRVVKNDGDDYAGLTVEEKLKKIQKKVEDDPTHQQLRQHDLSGVCPNVTTDWPPPPQDDDEPDVASDPSPQEEYHDRMTMPGIEDLIGQMTIDDEADADEPPELLELLQNQYSINTSIFQTDVEEAMHVIKSIHCVYKHSKHLPSTEAKNRMNHVLQVITPHLELDIPQNTTSILYQIFASTGDDTVAEDSAESFADELGESFGHAYAMLTGQNMDHNNNNNDDNDAGDGYFENETDSCGSWESYSDEEASEGSKSEDDSDGDAEGNGNESEEEVVPHERSVRPRRN
eukprot:scaffold391_cov88-Skeletonema_dohrnii-CCMP3373.AAC.5